MSPLPTNAHKGTPVLDKCSLTFRRKDKSTIEKTEKKTLVLNRMHPKFQLAKLSALWNSAVFNVNCSELA